MSARLLNSSIDRFIGVIRKIVGISFDPAKRSEVLVRRGLDLAEADLVFAGKTSSRQDDRQVYGEERVNTAGYLRGRCVIVTWTPRDGGRRIITMRHCHADEEDRWFGRMDRS